MDIFFPSHGLTSHQDAFAILLAAYHPSISLLGISTVHGNASLANTTRNTLSLLTLFNKTSIPVYSGASEALIRPALHAPDIHGASGIDGTTLLPEPTAVAQEGDAVEAMAKAVLATEKETAWIVGTGALTNIARAFQLFPELVEHVKGVSIMGGAIGGGFTNAKLGKVCFFPPLFMYGNVLLIGPGWRRRASGKLVRMGRVQYSN